MKNRFSKIITALLLTMLLMIPFIPTGLAADAPALSDSGNSHTLYNYLKNVKGFDSDNDGVIMQSEIHSLTGVLDLTGRDIQNLAGLNYADQITDLNLSDNTNLTSGASSNLTVLNVLSNLKSLELTNTGITTLPTMSGMSSLTSLSIGGSTPKTVAETPGTPMSISNPANIADIPKFKNPSTDNVILNISNTNITDASFLNSCAGLKYLFWRYQSQINTPVTFPSSANLYYLDLINDTHLGNSALTGIANIPKFKTYNLTPTTLAISATAITNVGALSAAAGLGTLYWQNSASLTSTQAGTLSNLSSLGKLTNIDLVNDSSLGNSILSTLSSLPHLNTIGVGNCGITDISALKNKTNITSIALGNNTGLVDLSPLGTLTNLGAIILTDCSVSDVSPLLGLKSLTYLDLFGNYLDPTTDSQDMQNIASIQTANPGITITGLDNQSKVDISYTIKPADSGKGTPIKASDSQYVGHSFTPGGVNITDSKYVFKGWDFDGNGTADILAGKAGSIPEGHLYIGGITFTAVFVDANYQVTFDPQNGNAVTVIGAAYNSTISAPVAPTKSGYSFEGWYKDSAGTTKWDFSKDVVTDNITLYAKWAQTFTVIYNGNGSTGGSVPADTNAYLNGAAVTVLGNTGSLVKTGYTFYGWNTSADGIGTFYAAGNTFKIANSNMTLYAVWQVVSPYLTSLGNSAGTLSPSVFTKTRLKYKLTLDEYTSSVTFTPVKENENSFMWINNSQVTTKTFDNIANGKTKTVTIKVKSNGKTKTYTIAVSRAKSTDTYLKSLTAYSGTTIIPFVESFDQTLRNYTLHLDENTGSVKLVGVANSSLEKLSNASKTYKLKNGQAGFKVSIKVKPQKGSAKSYYVTIDRAKSTDTSLKTLNTSAPGFKLVSTGTNKYTVDMPAGTTSFYIYANPNGYKASVTMDGVTRTKEKVTLTSAGSTVVKIIVKSQNGNTSEYDITVNHP